MLPFLFSVLFAFYIQGVLKFKKKSGAKRVNIQHTVFLTLKEIKSRLQLGNACYHWVQDLLSSSLLSRNLKIMLYRNIIFSVVLCGCETWSLTLREERRLRVFENRVLRRLFGLSETR
jgi:hypothetical protein